MPSTVILLEPKTKLSRAKYTNILNFNSFIRINFITGFLALHSREAYWKFNALLTYNQLKIY